jgi:hypothetical protein
MIKEKKLYLCNGCKQTGVRSYKSKVFESFFCPKCKKISTLFLPTQTIQNQPLVNYLTDQKEPESVIKPAIPEAHETYRTNAEPIQIDVVCESEKALFTIRDVFIFVAGLIVGLLIIKTTTGK